MNLLEENIPLEQRDLLTSVGVLTNHNATWKDHVAFTEGVDELTAKLPDIEEQT